MPCLNCCQEKFFIFSASSVFAAAAHVLCALCQEAGVRSSQFHLFTWNLLGYDPLWDVSSPLVSWLLGRLWEIRVRALIELVD